MGLFCSCVRIEDPRVITKNEICFYVFVLVGGTSSVSMFVLAGKDRRLGIQALRVNRQSMCLISCYDSDLLSARILPFIANCSDRRVWSTVVTPCFKALVTVSEGRFRTVIHTPNHQTVSRLYRSPCCLFVFEELYRRISARTHFFVRFVSRNGIALIRVSCGEKYWSSETFYRPSTC